MSAGRLGDTPPVLVLAPPRFVGPLGVMRSLGRMGVRVYGLQHDEASIASVSRWCAGTLPAGRNGRPFGQAEDVIVEQLLAAGRRLGGRTILVAGSDEWATFLANHAPALEAVFQFPSVPPPLVHQLTSKMGLHELATGHGVPTPAVQMPCRPEDLVAMAEKLGFPVMLKPVVSVPGAEHVALVDRAADLQERYQAVGGPGRVLLQEYVPGDDGDIWMYNGYFDRDSVSRFGSTARKVRQQPPGMGLCAVGVCERNQEVLDLVERFLSAVGYRGLVDVDLRWDRRDGTYKLLDVNPRLGGAFRLMTDRHGHDVVRAMYLDLTGRPVPAVEPREGRRWVLEAADLIAYRHYRRWHGLTVRGWLRSLRDVEEPATFSVRDPRPFLVAMGILVSDTLRARLRRASSRLRAYLRHLRPA